MRQRMQGGWRRIGAPGAMLVATAQAQEPARVPPAPAAGPWANLPDVLCAAGALVLVLAGVWLLVGALDDKRAGGFSLRRHAGGFGGSSTGWTMSAPLVRLLSGFALIVLAGALAMARVPLKDDGGKPAPGTDDKAEAGAAASGAASAASGAATTAASTPRK